MQNKDISFDNKNRDERLIKCKDQRYDLIIIGGGVTGAGIALDASLRGLSTLLLEKKDFASGTSSKSTKLIHGGLRYLKQFEFSLVKESGLERAIAHHNIPHLVHPEKMLLPIVDGGTFGKITASLAISVYDRLACVPRKDRKTVFNKNRTLLQEPLLNKSLLKSGIQYSEYRTDDARLTVELIKAARREGGEAFNYMKVIDFVYEQGNVVGVNCLDYVNDREVEFKATQVVSAAGPWVDELRTINRSKKGNSLQLTKGVHIVLPHHKLPVQSAVYFDDFKGRMLFAIPRGKVTYIGTSDTVYTSDKDRVICTYEDAEYILESINKLFEVEQLTHSDIISTWAGLRPLIHEEGKSPSELSRKDEIFVSESNLISIAGGKLTGYRKMAERVIDLVQERKKSLSKKECETEKYKIHSDSFSDYQDYKKFLENIKEKYADFNLSEFEAWYLVTTYGKHAELIIANALNSELKKSQALLRSEIDYCITYESCYLSDDYFNRRTGKIYFDVESVHDNLDFIVSEFASHFNWSSAKTEMMRKQSQIYLDDVTMIKV